MADHQILLDSGTTITVASNIHTFEELTQMQQSGAIDILTSKTGKRISVKGTQFQCITEG